MRIIINFERLNKNQKKKKKLKKRIKIHFLSIFPNIKKLLISGEEILMPAESKGNIT